MKKERWVRFSKQHPPLNERVQVMHLPATAGAPESEPTQKIVTTAIYREINGKISMSINYVKGVDYNTTITHWKKIQK